jgi:hypothetical protein
MWKPPLDSIKNVMQNENFKMQNGKTKTKFFLKPDALPGTYEAHPRTAGLRISKFSVPYYGCFYLYSKRLGNG